MLKIQDAVVRYKAGVPVMSNNCPSVTGNFSLTTPFGVTSGNSFNAGFIGRVELCAMLSLRGSENEGNMMRLLGDICIYRRGIYELCNSASSRASSSL